MILKEILQRIQSKYSKGVQSDDTRLSFRHIYSVIKTMRARLIVQKKNKKQFINSWNYVTLPCVELIRVPAHQCPCIPEIGCKILRTKNKLPKPLSGLSEHLIKSVTSIDGVINFAETTFEKKKFNKGNKYAKGKESYYLKDGYLFLELPASSGLKYISVEFLPDDFEEANKFENACDCVDCQDCTSILDKDFPFDYDIIDTLIELCSKELIEDFNKQKEDQSNNTADNLSKESK